MRDLLAACGRDDADAWREFVDRYGDLMYSIARKSGASPDEADDIFQTALVATHRKLATLRDAEKIVPWVISLTRRQAISYYRKYRRETPQPVEAFEDLIDPAVLPEAEVAALERGQLLHEALGDLRERCRAVITALYLTDPPPASYVDVARDLGMPVGSIGPTRARCLAALRSALEARGWKEGAPGSP